MAITSISAVTTYTRPTQYQVHKNFGIDREDDLHAQSHTVWQWMAVGGV